MHDGVGRTENGVTQERDRFRPARRPRKAEMNAEIRYFKKSSVTVELVFFFLFGKGVPPQQIFATSLGAWFL